MKLERLAGEELKLSEAIGALEVSSITADSRLVTQGSLFFALPGTNVDGAKFSKAACEKGAVAVISSITSEIADLPVPVLRVDDPRKTLAMCAARFFARQPDVIVSVTGTAGKTSVATFLRQIWEHEGRSAASLGTTGVVAPGRDEYGNLTTPDPITLHELLNELALGGVTHASMEASSHGLDQRRLDGVKLAAAGFTNLGRDHMDYHPTIEHYLASKMRLFEELLEAGNPAVIFADDPYSGAAIEVAKKAGLDVKTVGRKGEFLTLMKVEHHQFNQIVEVMHDTVLHRIEFPLAGDFQIANALVACGLAIATGTSAKDAFSALEKLKGASGRLEFVGKNTAGAPAYVDYAHKPEALENVLLSLRPFTSGRLIVVFGCGGDRDPGKREIMGEIANRLSDIVIVTDDNPRTEDPASIRAQVMAGAPKAKEIGDRGEAIHHACRLLESGDCLVVAGKGHEPGQIVGDTVLEFSDHAVIREALGVSCEAEDA